MTTATTEELAQLFDLSVQRVRELGRKGILLKKSRGQFDRDGSIKRYVSHLREVAAAHSSADEEIDAVKEGALLKRASRELIELRKAEIEGQVIRLDRITPTWSRIANAVRSAMLAIPGKARQHLPHLTLHDGEVLDRLCRDALENAGAVMNTPDVGAQPMEDDDLDDEEP